MVRAVRGRGPPTSRADIGAPVIGLSWTGGSILLFCMRDFARLLALKYGRRSGRLAEGERQRRIYAGACRRATLARRRWVTHPPDPPASWPNAPNEEMRA